MDQSLSIWVLIVLSVITANLPFLVEKPLLVLPWSLPGERSGLSPWLQLIVGLVYLLVLAALGLGIYTLIASSSGLNSLPLMVGKLLLGLALAAALFFFPAWRARHQKISKGFLSRLLEVCALYCIVGAFGFAFEASIGNPFKQTWVFYTITFALFLVMAYPGFVYRYLMRHPKGKFD
ncbi:DUF2818 family protein [Alcaligenes ammonioxydans]|uniref:DUF2818 family protein n=1 Tax=Alcaligenes ammonioxydans TaxID=2582914 RepID=A0ABX8SVJ4_9BURK|nr:DUF2818 family protein [Alcaligenes ammonioxydans]EJC64940.1 hypothetical protein QWA_05097 [Alcaligenes faecalis subsp. faecalis NCIB 8687]QBH18574.1 DUF2818 family protein [Alcaligenes faecalis]QXX79724.1 DUF2818 family protein [Alcaligenes ammonioxydans]